MPPALLLTVDVEEFILPGEAGVAFDPERAFELGRSGLERLAAVLKARGVPATFFATLGFARRYPDLLRDLVAAGHEPAFHAIDHDDDYRLLPAVAAKEVLGSGRLELEAIVERAVEGYRANRFRTPAPEVVAGAGFRWTSNLHPTWIPGQYNHFRAERRIHRQQALVEVPISVTPILRLPVSWFWMRNLGWPWMRLTAMRATSGTGYLNLYVHPWEFADLPRVPGFGLLARLSARRTGERFLRLMDRFLGWAGSRGFEARTVRTHLDRAGWGP